MRIIYISPEDLNQAHGGAVHTRCVAESLTRLGHQVLLVTPKAAKVDFEYRVVPMRYAGVHWPILAWRVQTELKKWQPDVVMERLLVSGGAGARMAQAWQIPYIAEVNSPHADEWLDRFFFLKPFAPLLKKRWRRLQEQAQVVVTTHQSLCVIDGHPGLLDVPWGVDSHRFKGFDQSARQQFRDNLSPHVKKWILIQGSFRPWHAPDFIRDLIKEVARTAKQEHWGFMVLGEGQGVENIRQCLTDQNLKHHAPGALSPEQMTPLLMSADLCLCPLEKPLADRPFYYSPFKILEAGASGCAVVASDHDNVRCILPKDRSVLLSGFKVSEWKEALIQAMAIPWNQAAGQAYAQEHSWDRHVTMILNKLKDVSP